MALLITDEILSKAQLSGDELLVELGCYLYEKKKLSMGRARGLANLNQIAF